MWLPAWLGVSLAALALQGCGAAAPHAAPRPPPSPALHPAAAIDPLAERPCVYGCPRSLAPDGGIAAGRLVQRKLYSLYNNPRTKLADWVAYEVRLERIGHSERRRWKADPELPENETLEPEDYRGAHRALQTDRGHQAPLAACSADPDWPTTNYLSNITPQRSGLNQGPWQRLEARVRDLAAHQGVVFVVTGPLFEREMPPLPGADEPHRVPSGYWKLVLLGDGRAAAFLFDQDTPRDFDECSAQVPIGEIERRAQLNLLPLLAVAQAHWLRDGSLASELACPAR